VIVLAYTLALAFVLVHLLVLAPELVRASALISGAALAPVSALAPESAPVPVFALVSMQQHERSVDDDVPDPLGGRFDLRAGGLFDRVARLRLLEVGVTIPEVAMLSLRQREIRARLPPQPSMDLRLATSRFYRGSPIGESRFYCARGGIA
jgi:hypothetical protein